MLTRAEIDKRLAILAKVLPRTDGGNVHLTEERDALETAKRLGEWPSTCEGPCGMWRGDTFTAWCSAWYRSDGKTGCRRADWLRGEGPCCESTGSSSSMWRMP
jgi:hypothetical protein